jgi:hypothetical protein
MPKIEFPQLPQFAGTFTRLGHHQDHEWEPLPWKGVYNKPCQSTFCRTRQHSFIVKTARPSTPES